MTSVIIVQYGHPAMTRRAVDSLRVHSAGEVDVVVVDNGSAESGGDQAAAERNGYRTIENRRNLGFGSANNIGARATRGDLILFLNSDTLVHGEILPGIESYFALNPRCGAAGLRLLNSDGTEQNSTGKIPTVWSIWNTRRRDYLYRSPDPVLRDWVSGAALVVRRSVFEEMGGFDERYFMYFEDVDLCARIRRAGHEIHFISGISVEHLGGGSQSGGKSLLVEKEFRNSQVLCYSRHSSTLDNVLLRIYLFIRFFPQLLPGDRERREVASHVLSILLRPAHERRH